jgi:hypothetical protein
MSCLFEQQPRIIFSSKRLKSLGMPFEQIGCSEQNGFDNALSARRFFDSAFFIKHHNFNMMPSGMFIAVLQIIQCRLSFG